MSFSETVVPQPCADGEVFLPFFSTCYKVTCREGFELRFGRCTRIPVSTSKSLPNYNNSTTPATVSLYNLKRNEPVSLYEEDVIFVQISIISIMNDSESVAEYVTSYLSENIEGLEIDDRDACSGNASTMTEKQCRQNSSNCLIRFNMTTRIEIDTKRLEEQFDHLFTKIDHIMYDMSHAVISLQCGIGNESLFSDCLSHRDIKDFEYLTSEINVTGSASVCSLTYSRVGDKVEYTKMSDAEICEKTEILLCPHVVLNHSNFVTTRNGNLKHLSSGYEMFKKDYLITIDGTVLVCSRVFDKTHEPIKQSIEESIVTITGFSCSICANVLTLMSYARFSVLRRTTFNKFVMSFCTWLTIAQLTWMVSGIAVVNPPGCSFVAALGHYAWLVTIFTTLAMAVDLYRRFGKVANVNPRPDENMKKFFLVLSLTYGLPLLLVIPTAFIHTFGGGLVPLSYGDDHFCWIRGNKGLLVVFVLPLCVIIFFDCVLYIQAVYGLHQARMKRHGGDVLATLKQIAKQTSIAMKAGFTLAIYTIQKVMQHDFDRLYLFVHES